MVMQLQRKSKSTFPVHDHKVNIAVGTVVVGGKVLPESAWLLPDPLDSDPEGDVIAIGAELDPATVLRAYTQGLFPMHLGGEDTDQRGDLAWWSPNPRGILPLEALRVSRSLRKSLRRFTVTFDTRFTEVMTLCQRPLDGGQWITGEFIETYSHLHRLGYAHSVEVWNQESQLVGGLYGLELGGLFAGESMFHLERDASKAALVHLVKKLNACGGNRMLDVQWRTDHLATLGVIEISRHDYIQRLRTVLPTMSCFD
jgi:leucyl/phenylalanyl-tRNA---protein transferase